MSNLSERTEKKALTIIAKSVKAFESLHFMDMTATDDYDVTAARNLLEGVIQSNGYRIAYQSKKAIIKEQKQRVKASAVTSSFTLNVNDHENRSKEK